MHWIKLKLFGIFEAEASKIYIPVYEMQCHVKIQLFK